MDLKERANVLFRKHEFKQAAEIYAQAEKQNPEDPTFASNLSAALFEAGDYAGCFSALSRSFTAISANPEGREALALRLSTRLAKTLSNGLTVGSVTIARIEDEREVVEGLKAKMENEGGGKAGDEARKEWKEWGRVKVEIGGIGEKERTQARNEVAKLGVTKKPIDPVLEYYFMGHDPILSIVDDWGPGDSAPMRLDKYPFELLPNLAFLFGGVGDARHVYASLIGLHHAHARLSSARRNALHAHFTLLDIHPTMLLRDLVVLMLLERLVRGTNRKEEREEIKEEREEIKAAVFYTFVGVVVPEMYNKWVITVVKDLHTMVSTTPPTLPAWLHLSPDTAAGVLSVLKKWDPFPPARTAQNIIMHYSYRPTPVELLTKTLSQPNLAAQTSARRQKILATLTNYPASLKEVMARVPNGPYPSLTRAQAVEELWHQATTTFVPPKRALAHLPKSAILLEFMQSAERRVHGKETLEGIHQEAMAEIEAKYAANTTFYDPLSCENRVMAFGGWTNLRGKNVFEPVRFLEEFNERFRLPSPTPSPTSHAPAFGAVTTFFDAVVSAWKSLGNKVVFEVVVGELNQEMAKMRSPEGEAARPAAFPREYTRMWLSNVPDYNHGLMNQIVYVLPSLQTHRHAGIASNCLLHTLSFPDKDDYCHTYTHLTPQDVPRYLNCRIDRLDPMTIELVGWNSPSRALATLPPRAAVLRWLTRVLLNILWPGDLTLRQKSYIGDGVRHTSSLNAFLALLLHLPTLGYPAHWLAEFVETLLGDALWADFPLFVGPLPIPKRQSERKVETWRVRLGPWLPELRTLLALAAPIAPFPLPRLSAHAGIALYDASPLITSSNLLDLYQAVSAHAPSTSLLLLDPRVAQRSAGEIVRDVRGLLEGKGAKGVAILTAPDEVDVTRSVVRWRMLEEEAETMRKEGWVAVLFRYDNNTTVGKPMLASAWKKIEDIRAADA